MLDKTEQKYKKERMKNTRHKTSKQWNFSLSCLSLVPLQRQQYTDRMIRKTRGISDGKSLTLIHDNKGPQNTVHT